MFPWGIRSPKLAPQGCIKNQEGIFYKQLKFYQQSYLAKWNLVHQNKCQQGISWGIRLDYLGRNSQLGRLGISLMPRGLSQIGKFQMGKFNADSFLFLQGNNIRLDK